MWRRTEPASFDAPAPAGGPARARRNAWPALVALAVLALPAIAWVARLRGFTTLANVLALGLVLAALAGVVRAIGARATALLVAAAAALAAAAAWFALPPIYWPPVAINLAVASAFGVSLRSGEPLVLRFARMEGAVSTPALVRYCRRLTLVWMVHLLMLGLAGIAIAVHGDERIGAWWCGLVNYLLVALLFVGERVYRRMRGDTPVGLIEQLRSVRKALRTPPS